MFEQEQKSLEYQKIEDEKMYNEVCSELNQLSTKLENILELNILRGQAKATKLMIPIFLKYGIIAWVVSSVIAQLMLPGESFLQLLMNVGKLTSILIAALSGFIYWDYRDLKKQYQKLETPELLEDEKNEEKIKKRKQKLQKLEKKLKNEINKNKKILESIKIIHDFAGEIAIEKKIEYEQIMQDYLNEPIDYASINLEINQIEGNVHKNSGKILSKRL